MDKINTYIKTIEKAQLFIDLKLLKHNYRLINQITNKSLIIGVVKGDGYGHGMMKCSETLIKSGCKNLYVANIDDALNLRNIYKKVRIFVLSGPINHHEVGILDKNRITPFPSVNLFVVF